MTRVNSAGVNSGDLSLSQQGSLSRGSLSRGSLSRGALSRQGEFSLPRQRARRAGAISDYVELTKPRILVLELVTVVVAAHLAAPGAIGPWLLLHTVCGAGLVAASAGAANQWLERTSDALMARTVGRPLPQGRLGSSEVIAFTLATLLLGTAQLALFVRPLTAVMGLATWLVYVAAYTPLKRVSPVNTAVGAISGALPILIGWTAAGAGIDARGLALAGVVFLWQFPHFMAIAWIYRDEYRRAGHLMLTVVDPTGFRPGAQAMIAALALIPMSLVPALAPFTGSPTVYCGWALLLGIVQLLVAVNFWIRPDDRSARWLLRTSLLYLSCLMALLLIVTV